jgi:hypothetical protein
MVNMRGYIAQAKRYLVKWATTTTTRDKWRREELQKFKKD